MSKRLTRHDYEALACEHQLEWVGEEVPDNVLEKTTWRCAKGHYWEIPYRNIKYDGSGCPHCAGVARKKVEDYRVLAKRRGFEWLGPPVKNVRTKTQWRCSEGHTWLAAYDSIRRGTGCPTCAGTGRKTEADYHTLAEERGFEWLGPPVKNVRTKTQWRCGEGHTWLTTYMSIRQGTGCSTCARRSRKSEADYHALAKKRNIKWLGPPVKNTKTKTQWRCNKNHTWLTTYRLIQRGSNCPICAGKKPKTEADYHTLAGRRGLEWLGPLPKNVNTKSEWRCAKKHTWFATYNGIRLRGKCPTCAKKSRKRKADYHILAKRHGLEWLGPPVKNTKTKTQWRCSKGHIWFTTYNSVQQGTECGECQRLKRKQNKR